MSMMPTVYSINGLAVELNRDRRTIADALRGVAPEGTVSGGHSGWTLATALAALSDRSTRSPALEHFASRVVDWQELAGREPVTVSIDEAAEMFRLPRETLLTWLRAGLAYVTRGDLATGDGFMLRPSWILDFQIVMTCIAAAANWPATAKTLRIERN